jgi:hypothetical protein
LSDLHHDSARRHWLKLSIDKQTVVPWRALLLHPGRALERGSRQQTQGGKPMSVFMVQRELGKIAMDDLAAAQKAAIATAEATTARGTPVRYIRSAFVPENGRCFCFFEAERSEDVAAVNREAKIPYTKIVEALDLPG